MNIEQGMLNVEVVRHRTSKFKIPCSTFIIQGVLQPVPENADVPAYVSFERGFRVFRLLR
jgi:uncharacterized protein (UPF0128 family)